MTNKLFTFLLMALTISCSKPKSKDIADSNKKEGLPGTMFEFHYKYSSSVDKLGNKLKAIAGPSVYMLWSALKGFSNIDLWVFPIANQKISEKVMPTVAVCIKGMSKDLIYNALKKDDGTLITKKLNIYQEFSSKKLSGSPKYIIFDDDKKLCIASSKNLLNKVRTISDFNFKKSTDFITMTSDIQSMFKASQLMNTDDIIKNIIENSPEKKSLKKFFKLFEKTKSISLNLGLDSNTNLTIEMPISWGKGAPILKLFSDQSFIKIPEKSKNDIFVFSSLLNLGALGIDYNKIMKSARHPKIEKKVIAFMKSATYLLVTGSLTKENHLNLKSKISTSGQFDIANLYDELGKQMNEAPNIKKDKNVKLDFGKDFFKITWNYTENAVANNYDKDFTKMMGKSGNWTISHSNNDVFFNFEELKNHKIPLRKVATIFASFSPLNFIKMYSKGVADLPELQELKKLKISQRDDIVLTITTDKKSRNALLSFSLPLGIWLDILKDNPKLLKQLKEHKSKKKAAKYNSAL